MWDRTGPSVTSNKEDAEVYSKYITSMLYVAMAWFLLLQYTGVNITFLNCTFGILFYGKNYMMQTTVIIFWGQMYTTGLCKFFLYKVTCAAFTYQCWGLPRGLAQCTTSGRTSVQTLICVPVARPRRCPTLSNPVPWQNWMAAYLSYTLWMKTLFRGWPVMVNDTHTRRRRLVHTYFTSPAWCSGYPAHSVQDCSYCIWLHRSSVLQRRLQHSATVVNTSSRANLCSAYRGDMFFLLNRTQLGWRRFHVIRPSGQPQVCY